MQTDDLGEARRRLPLPELLGALGYGDYEVGKRIRCPFKERHKHSDKDPSFIIRFNSQTGRYHGKYYAICGAIDEIKLIQGHFSLTTFVDALKQYCELAGVKSSAEVLPDWDACVHALSDAKLKEIAAWRGFSLEFLSRFKKGRRIGWHKGCIAFPVIDNTGKLVAIHCCRLHSKKWFYQPRGAKAWPFIIGELAGPGYVIAAESTWDGLDYLDKSGETGGVIISRGKEFGSRIALALEPGKVVCALMQHDDACEHWLQELCAPGKLTVKAVRVPEKFNGAEKIHDLNDWTRAGATPDDLWRAVTAAEIVATPALQSNGASPADAEESSADFQAAPTKIEIEEPEELEEPEKTAALCPIECLPPVLRDMAEATADLYGNTAMSAAIVLAAASASIGKGIVTRDGRRHITPANLFSLISKVSGSGGSETARRVMRPLTNYHYKLHREFEEDERPEIEAKIQMATAQMENLKAQLKKDPDDRRRIEGELKLVLAQLSALKRRACPGLVIGNATPAGLTQYLAKVDDTVFHYECDLGVALSILCGQSENKGSDTVIQVDVWLKGFSWEQIQSTRVASGIADVEEPCIGLCFLMTPDKARALFKDQRLIDTGFLPRCLVCDPKARPRLWNPSAIATSEQWRDEAFKRYDRGVTAVIERFRLFKERRMEEEKSDRQIRPYLLEMDDEAIELDIADYNRVIASLGDGQEHPFETRRNEIGNRLALVLQTFDCIDFGEKEGKLQATAYAHREGQKLTAKWVQNALRWMDWYDQEQREFRQIGEVINEDIRWQKIRALTLDRPRSVGITARDLYRGGKVFRNVKEAENGLAKLVKDELLERFVREPRPGVSGSRPVISYRLSSWGRNG